MSGDEPVGGPSDGRADSRMGSHTDPRRLEPVTGQWNRVSPSFIVVDLLGSAAAGLVATVVAGVPLALSAFQWQWLWLLPAALFLGTIVYLAFTPRRVRAIGYQLRADDFLVRRGLLFQRFVAVPYGRMQLVDVNRGPIARLVGLAELKLSTAAESSRVELPGLPLAEAEALRDRIVELAESRRAGL